MKKQDLTSKGNSKYAQKIKGSTWVRFKYWCIYREIWIEGKYRVPAESA